MLHYHLLPQIARKCGIETEEEFGDALWFLHNRVGVIRYFQDIPELHSVIINSPQYIFDKVTELIVSTFTFENTTANVYEQFLKKGVYYSVLTCVMFAPEIEMDD